jgi:hypothetical protein
MAPLGASVTQMLPVKTLRIMFAIILLAVAAQIGIKTFSITILTDHTKQLFTKYIEHMTSTPNPSASMPDFLQRHEENASKGSL